MRLVRLELTRIFQHMFLRHARLPLLHRRSTKYLGKSFNSITVSTNSTTPRFCSWRQELNLYGSVPSDLSSFDKLNIAVTFLVYFSPFAKVGVALTGLEPIRLSTPAFETGAATNYATEPFECGIIPIWNCLLTWRHD